MSGPQDQGEKPPPQQIYVLSLSSISQTEAVLTTLEGKEARIALDFTGDTPFSHATSDVQPTAYQGLQMTVKDLGKLARRKLGLDPITPLHVSARILFGSQVLPMHRPIATLLEPNSLPFLQAYRHCHYWQGAMFLFPSDPANFGPFENCPFCGDAPAWHHRCCCPHNPVSVFCRGPPHGERYHVDWIRRYQSNGNLQ